MSESKSDRDRWRKSLADLGLEEMPPTAEPPPPPAPPVEPEPVHEERADEPRAAANEPEPYEPIPEVLDESVQEVEFVVTHAGEASESVEIEEAEEPVEVAGGQPEGEETGEKKRRRRRRRRRGKGDRAEAGAESAKIEGAPVEESADREEQEAETPSPRGRAHDQRGRRGGPPVREKRAVIEPAGTEEPEEIVAPALDDDEPLENVSSWNVPSWEEILASLHRPDR